MAFTSREFDKPSAHLYAVLIDPQSYPQWLVGTSDIREVDDTWPAPGSQFHHRVGVGRLSLPDSTTLLSTRPGEELVLKVRVRPLLVAEVVFRIVGNASHCVVTIQEEPTSRLIGNLVRPLLDPVIHIRNHRSLRRLDKYLSHVS